MKKFRVTYTETKDITVIVEARDKDHAHEVFHNARDYHDLVLYLIPVKETKIEEVKDESSAK